MEWSAVEWVECSGAKWGGVEWSGVDCMGWLGGVQWGRVQGGRTVLHPVHSAALHSAPPLQCTTPHRSRWSACHPTHFCCWLMNLVGLVLLLLLVAPWSYHWCNRRRRGQRRRNLDQTPPNSCNRKYGRHPLDVEFCSNCARPLFDRLHLNEISQGENVCTIVFDECFPFLEIPMCPKCSFERLFLLHDHACF